MADFAVRFNDFSGGDWGDLDPSKVKANQFSGKNVALYSDGLLGVRPGLKLLNLTGKVYPSVPTINGNIRGFDVMGNKLMVATNDKTYDVYWDLSLAPGGTLPANAPIPLPGTPSATAQAQLLRGADTAMKEFLLIDGKLYYRTGDPAGAWTATGPTGKNLSIVTRWNLYLVAVDRDQPWIIWFSQVDSNGPNFLTWPSANFLFVGTTETITVLLSIFNMLYAGRASGWWGISGVLGVLASVRELAIGNGPVDQRMASVTTDNRIVYWPYQLVPAFWNGERVSLINDQRMDPRGTFLDATPVTVRTDATPDYAGPPASITIPVGITEIAMPDAVRTVSPAWTASVVHTGGTTTYVERRRNLPRYTSIIVPPGFTDIVLDQTITADSGFTPDGTFTGFTAAASATYEITARAMLNGVPGAGHYLGVYVDGVEAARSPVWTGANNSGYIYVSARVAVTAGQKVTLRFFNAGTTNASIFCEPLLSNQFSPYMKIAQVPTIPAGARWVCPTTGSYDVFARVSPNQANGNVMLLRNGLTLLSTAIVYPTTELTLSNQAFTAGDELSLAVAYRDPGTIAQAGGGEAADTPMLSITSRATAQQVGVLGAAADSVVVTPTERRLMLLGDDGGQSKVWTYGNGVWTHHYMPMLLAGMAPTDVRGSYLLPEHVVFAIKRTFTSEPLKVWSLNHDLDRPAFVSDQWASPYDQSMPAGDIMVKGEVALPQWFDGQGRQVRVRSVVVNFRKWDQGIVGGTNQIAARVDACGPYDRGVQPGTEVTWTEPMSAASNQGTDDSWRFNVGEQGFGNGFQVVLTALYGVAIREVVALVDVRTERT